LRLILCFEEADGRAESRPACTGVGHRPAFAAPSILAHWQNVGLPVYSLRAAGSSPHRSLVIFAGFSRPDCVTCKSSRWGDYSLTVSTGCLAEMEKYNEKHQVCIAAGRYRLLLETGKSKLEIAAAEFKRRVRYFPEIGYNFGVYKYTPWKVIYPLRTFDREKVAEALNTMSDKGKGPTPLANGVEEAEKVIANLSGRTVLFLFYDGDFTGRSPDPALWRLVKEKDTCLIMISSASETENEKLQANISRLNACSRLIPLQYFMKGNPKSCALLSGYTDNVGIEDYNEHLSQLRTEMVAGYLAESHGIDESRLVLHYHGSDNPVASNDTDEGRRPDKEQAR
jgi:hypothetical protein